MHAISTTRLTPLDQTRLGYAVAAGTAILMMFGALRYWVVRPIAAAWSRPIG